MPLDFARPLEFGAEADLDRRAVLAGAAEEARARVTKRPSAVNWPSTTWKRVRQRGLEPSRCTGVPRGAAWLSAVGVSAKSHGAATSESDDSERPSSTTTTRTTQALSHGDATSPL